MIRKIIKNRKQITEGIAMVSALYAVIAIHTVRTIINAKNTRAYSNY
jgi:hypothetical protein